MTVWKSHGMLSDPFHYLKQYLSFILLFYLHSAESTLCPHDSLHQGPRRGGAADA